MPGILYNNCNNNMQLIVYYRVPATAEGYKREKVKRKFENFARNIVAV
jgi:hypothetical protein